MIFWVEANKFSCVGDFSNFISLCLFRMAQIAQQEANVETALHEMSKPLSRFKDDEDLDAMLKDQEREGDPMLAFMKKKKSQEKNTKGIDFIRINKLLCN